jgi:hypothetical protein
LGKKEARVELDSDKITEQVVIDEITGLGFQVKLK